MDTSMAMAMAMAMALNNMQITSLLLPHQFMCNQGQIQF
jgi:hypothetical protein